MNTFISGKLMGQVAILCQLSSSLKIPVTLCVFQAIFLFFSFCFDTLLLVIISILVNILMHEITAFAD